MDTKMIFISFVGLCLTFVPAATGSDIVEVRKAVNSTYGAISQNCLQCICQIEGCQVGPNSCHMDVGSLSCGPYQIKEPYWIDCHRPGGGYKQCATTMPCSVTCVRDYTERYGKTCTGGSVPTCEDYSRIHNGGPKGCKKSATEGYWKKVKACCDNKFGGNC